MKKILLLTLFLSAINFLPIFNNTDNCFHTTRVGGVPSESISAPIRTEILSMRGPASVATLLPVMGQCAKALKNFFSSLSTASSFKKRREILRALSDGGDGSMLHSTEEYLAELSFRVLDLTEIIDDLQIAQNPTLREFWFESFISLGNGVEIAFKRFKEDPACLDYLQYKIFQDILHDAYIQTSRVKTIAYISMFNADRLKRARKRIIRAYELRHTLTPSAKMKLADFEISSDLINQKVIVQLKDSEQTIEGKFVDIVFKDDEKYYAIISDVGKDVTDEMEALIPLEKIDEISRL